jgi:hypothetical protein
MALPIITAIRACRDLKESVLHTALEIAHRTSIYGVARVRGFPQFWNKKRRSVVSICATGTCMATHTLCDRTMATGPLS